MTIIEVRPSKKFRGAWVAFEDPGIEPAFAAPDAKQKAILYACGGFGRESRRDSRLSALFYPSLARAWNDWLTHTGTNS
jgi:hypothetical protein